VAPRFSRRAALAAGGALALAGCSSQATVEQSASGAPRSLTLAHSLGDTHPTSHALNEFAQLVAERSEERLTVQMISGGVLGTETEVLEQLRRGIVDLTRVAAPGLAQYFDPYHAFGLPFVFDDEEHFYATMDSAAMQEIFTASMDHGFRGLTYYTSGARSFYTVDTPIRTVEDLAGMKIRIQNFASQTDLMHELGGSPIVMGLGDVYTGLQTGMIDGAESNETALTDSAHGEIAKVFSYTEHTMIPDLLAIGTPTWDSLSEEDRSILTEAAIESTENHKTLWAETVEQAIVDSRAMGVEFVEDVDRDSFREATSSLVDDYLEQYPQIQDVLDIIEQAR
jgi:tripartite ATP-independent transporter DctP family solute receptor